MHSSLPTASLTVYICIYILLSYNPTSSTETSTLSKECPPKKYCSTTTPSAPELRNALCFLCFIEIRHRARRDYHRCEEEN